MKNIIKQIIKILDIIIIKLINMSSKAKSILINKIKYLLKQLLNILKIIFKQIIKLISKIFNLIKLIKVKYCNFQNQIIYPILLNTIK